MIDLRLVVLILFLHWLGDFYFQTDAMAKNKSTSNLWLSSHVSMYLATLTTGMTFVGMFGLLWYLPPGKEQTIGMFLGLGEWLFLNAACHWVTDYVTSRITSRLWKAGRVHDFFVVIGMDQFVHVVTLLVTAGWLLK